MILDKELFLYVDHQYGTTKITLLEAPGPDDWMGVYRRALICQNQHPVHAPTSEWIAKILRARHSPIRRAIYSFEFTDIPSNTSTHLARHKHADSYVGSLRVDRITPAYLKQLAKQFGKNINGDNAPRITPTCMIFDLNAEEIQVFMNKRLCFQASEITRLIAEGMKQLVISETPEIKPLLVPMCERCGGICYEMKPCGKWRELI